VARTKEILRRAAAEAQRDAPPLAVWVPAACDPTAQAWDQLARQLVVYVGAAGYGEMFREAGFDDTVALARSGAHPREVLAAMPRELMHAVGAIGDRARVAEALDAYARAGADEIGIVPVTAGDDAGTRLLRALAPVRA
jgi:alkanesulfonate monooxygenase SsuD/methylene tetrahydromethanopterin reductase-like flavin-dependent oxidoreductase (luciferase family)